MKRFLLLTLFICLSAIGMMGCSDKKSTESELKITTAGGETTITRERDVEQSDE